MRFTALALLLVVAVVAADVAPLLHADSPNVIPGSYLVILKKGLDVMARDAHILSLKDTIVASSAQDSEIGWVYNIGSFIGFSARLSEELLKVELAHPDVEYIECDQVMSINYIQEEQAPAAITQTGATWGLDRVDQRNLPLNGLYTYTASAGGGVDVYVIDTGILVTHNDFGGRASFVFSSIAGEANTDLNGHGTHCAGTVAGTTYGVAKQATLFAVKVLNAGGSGTTAGVVAGVNYVTNNKRPGRGSIGSMSLGGGVSQALDDSVIASIAAGVAYSIAAGNSNANACNGSPARVPNAVTVGASANTDARSTFSSFGPCVDIFAPGTSITSAWIGSNTATNTISGTSMATPHVAGGIALYLAGTPAATPAQVDAYLRQTATPNVITNPGTGSPNYLLFTNPQ